jgi:Domain of unknown function (DUF4365)
MAKKITQEQITGERGVALVHARVSAMGFLWHPTGGTEAGIDGMIELRDGRTGAVTNQVVQVQIRATGGRFTAETDDTFEYLCDKRELDYWLGGNAPVILVRSRPETDEAYWVPLGEYFADPARRASRRVVFDKKRDCFDVSCRDRLVRLAVPRDSGIYIAPPPKTEQLVANLLEVVAYPRQIYVTETDFRKGGALAAALRLEDPNAGREWFLRNKRLFSLHDLAEPPWSTVCDAGSVEQFDAEEWALADDLVREHEFAELLYCCLYEKTKRELRYLGREKLFYARPGRDLAPRRLRASGRRRRGRIVFRAYESKKRAGEIGFCKHWGFHSHFRRYGGHWYLEIEPSYHYTFDGYRKSRYAGDYLANAKSQEHNDAVRQLVQMWARYLRGPHDLFSQRYKHLEFGDLRAFELPVGVNDQLWLDNARKRPAEPEPDDDEGEGRLFAA